MSNSDNMKENMYNGKTYSFVELLENYRVEIPIIQRDYAQGRKDKQEIRDNFLNALYLSVNDGKPIKLDFIYGSKNDFSFLPLDGQQRLTTLFLLHWYAAGKNEGEISLEKAQLLNKFSYETRISSREFCSALITNSVNINYKQEQISSQIIDSPWFFLSWKSDPTIDAMLRSLDDIHKKFYEIENLWTKLELISFYHIELENIGLTDDLYIKMNARGKLLSSFENFKASFEKYITEQKWEENVNPLLSFAFKIDTEWTDFLWKYFKKDNSIDETFMRFISTIIMARQAIERVEDRIVTITKLQENPHLLRPEHISESTFSYLKVCFELYCRVTNDNLDLTLPFPLWRHTPKTSLFSEIIFEYNSFAQTNSASYTQKVLFFAQTEYLLKCSKFDQTNFEDWMRVIRNIIARGYIERNGKRPDIIRSPQTFDGVVNLIAELSEGCEDIYSFLASKDKLNSSFAKDQIDEERTKSKLIEKDLNNKKIIFNAEDNDLLMGRIEFALYCSDFNGNINSFNADKFTQVQEVISKYFQKETDISNDLRRALLTIEVNGNYDYYGYWWSFWNVVSANKRCLIDNFRELEYYIYSGHKEYFKKLILRLTTYDLHQIVNNFAPPSTMPSWKKRLITDKELLDKKSKSNYIAIPTENNCCYLLRSKRPRDIEGCVLIE